jgi:hypothetical protein
MAASIRVVSDEEGPARDEEEGIEEQPFDTQMIDSSVDLSQSRSHGLEQPTDMSMQLEDSKDNMLPTVEKVPDDEVPSSISLPTVKDVPSAMITTETGPMPITTSSQSSAQLQRTHVLFDQEYPFFYDASHGYSAALATHSTTDSSVWGPPELTDDWYIDEVEHASLVPICKWTLRKHATRMDTSATTVKTLPSAARYDTSPLVSRKLVT